MLVLELTQPGARLDHFSDPQIRERATHLVHHIIGCVADVAVTFQMYQDVENSPRPSPEQKYAQMESDSRRRHDLQVEFSRRPGESFDDALGRYEWTQFDTQAAERVRRENWAAGRVPLSYGRSATRICARSFIYALDGVLKSLEQLSSLAEAPEGTKQALEQMKEKFPGLVEVRNSAHHPEDRVQQRARKKTITPQPIETDLISAPTGGIFMTDGIVMGRYGGTTSTGDYAEVPISVESARAARDIVQQALNSFKWSGPSIPVPYE